MKQPLLTFVAAAAGIALALWAYDHFVVEARDAARSQRLRTDLDDARIEAQDIAAGVEASVQRSVGDARTAMQEQAVELEQRRLASDALARTGMFKAGVSEFYVAQGRWPDSAADAGLPAPQASRSGAIEAIRLLEHGTIEVLLDSPFAPGSIIRLRPLSRVDGSVSWHCATQGDPALRRALLACSG